MTRRGWNRDTAGVMSSHSIGGYVDAWTRQPMLALGRLVGA
jgi:hypothetical protein